MDDATRFQLIGTYSMPRFRYGRIVFCEVRGEVTLCGLTDAPMLWSIGKRRRRLQLPDGDGRQQMTPAS